MIKDLKQIKEHLKGHSEIELPYPFKKDVHMFQKKVPSFTDADGVEWSGYEYIGVKK